MFFDKRVPLSISPLKWEKCEAFSVEGTEEALPGEEALQFLA